LAPDVLVTSVDGVSAATARSRQSGVQVLADERGQ
jgi:hypothetical protein